MEFPAKVIFVAERKVLQSGSSRPSIDCDSMPGQVSHALIIDKFGRRLLQIGRGLPSPANGAGLFLLQQKKGAMLRMSQAGSYNPVP
jgi:hypothetical protein